MSDFVHGEGHVNEIIIQFLCTPLHLLKYKYYMKAGMLQT